MTRETAVQPPLIPDAVCRTETDWKQDYGWTSACKLPALHEGEHLSRFKDEYLDALRAEIEAMPPRARCQCCSELSADLVTGVCQDCTAETERDMQYGGLL